MPSIIAEIEVAEQEIQLCEKKLDRIETRLRVSELTDDEIKMLQLEERTLKKKVQSKRDSLSTLRKENGKTTFLSFVMLGIICLIYYVFWTP
ncbi:uncharacterized protein LOC128209931 [Mya arenaria]|uniref:uncharacterized protein LOC128209931 n=1 Tax=Mya arenaria TaxID=6604 RepID=UPI0022E8FD2B|nr:uncharacterized protein LOC128209931 [Mya arenaria]